MYLFILYFYSVYQRIVKARDLVAEKVTQDFTDDFSERNW